MSTSTAEYLQGDRLGDDGEDLVHHVAGELGGVRGDSELVEPGVVLQGGDDTDQVPLIQVLKVRQRQLVRVVGEVDGVHVPGHLHQILHTIPVRQFVNNVVGGGRNYLFH